MAHVLHAGLCIHSTEATQHSLARYLVKLLSSPSSLNATQTQLVLIELSHLNRILGEAAGSYIPDLHPLLIKLLSSLSYSVRFEAAVTLSSLLSAQAHLAAHLLSTVCEGTRRQVEALTELEEGADGMEGAEEGSESRAVSPMPEEGEGSGTGRSGGAGEARR